MDSTALGPITTSVSLLPWSQGRKLKQHVETSKLFGKAYRCMLLKQKIQLRDLNSSVGSSSRYGSKFKLLRISSFKSSVQNGESGEGENLSKVPKDTREDGAVSPKVTSKAKTVLRSFTSGKVNGTAATPSINKFFRRWPTMLCTQQASEEVDGILGGVALRVTSATTQERNEILAAVWFYLLNLDSMIKIPLLTFIPLYLIVNIFYGAQVSKELTPLWVLGPFIVAFYIKMLYWLCDLSISSLKQTAYLIKIFPRYYKVACERVSHGRLKEEVQARVWSPVVNIRNLLHYTELSRRKFKFMQEWIMERYLDFLESVWPYYCRVIRFLKRANLI